MLEEQIAQLANPQEFTKLCNIVFTQKYGTDFQVIDGSRGDGGNDGYIISEKCIVAMYCPIKPEQRTDKDYLKKIYGDIEKAKKLRDNGTYEIEVWRFITPRKLSNTVIAEMREKAKIIGINAIHQDSTFLATELSKNTHLIKLFPNLQISLISDEIKQLLKKSDTNQTITQQEEVAKKPIYSEGIQNNEEFNQILKIRYSDRSEESKSALKVIYYKTIDPVIKINAILGLLDYNNIHNDNLEEMLKLCNEGIGIAESIKATYLKAYLLGRKGYVLSIIYSELDMETAYKIKLSNTIFMPSITEDERQQTLERLRNLGDDYNNSFIQAINLAKENNNFAILANIYIFIGIAAGQRAMYLRKFDVKERAEAEKAFCKQALSTAKNIYGYLQDELGIAETLYNLANQIRFLNEEVEALLLLKEVSKIAQNHENNNLFNRSNELIKIIETKEF